MRTIRRAAAVAALAMVPTVTVSGVAHADGDQPRPLELCTKEGRCYLVDGRVLDSDGDGAADDDELALGTDPKDPSSRPSAEELILAALHRRLPSFDKALGAIALPTSGNVTLFGKTTALRPTGVGALSTLGVDISRWVGMAASSAPALAPTLPKGGVASVPASKLPGAVSSGRGPGAPYMFSLNHLRERDTDLHGPSNSVGDYSVSYAGGGVDRITSMGGSSGWKEGGSHPTANDFRNGDHHKVDHWKVTSKDDDGNVIGSVDVAHVVGSEKQPDGSTVKVDIWVAQYDDGSSIQTETVTVVGADGTTVSQETHTVVTSSDGSSMSTSSSETPGLRSTSPFAIGDGGDAGRRESDDVGTGFVLTEVDVDRVIDRLGWATRPAPSDGEGPSLDPSQIPDWTVVAYIVPDDQGGTAGVVLVPSEAPKDPSIRTTTPGPEDGQPDAILEAILSSPTGGFRGGGCQIQRTC